MHNLLLTILVSLLSLSSFAQSDVESCEQDDKHACFRLGQKFNTEETVDESMKFYQKSCEIGYYYACAKLGHLYEYSKKDLKQAKKYYERNCKYGIEDGTCDILKSLESKMAKDLPVKPKKLSPGQLCDQGNLKLCIETAHQVYNQNLDSRDYGKGDVVKAKSLFKKACDGGELEGCFYLGNLDYVNRVPLYKKSCEGGLMKGCHNLGSYEASMGNNTEAKRLYGLACKSGIPQSCSQIEELNQVELKTKKLSELPKKLGCTKFEDLGDGGFTCMEGSLKHGKFLFESEHQKIEGQYFKDLASGKWIITDKINGNKIQNFKNGKLDGETLTFHPNGKLRLKEIYVQGDQKKLTHFSDAGVLVLGCSYIHSGYSRCGNGGCSGLTQEQLPIVGQPGDTKEDLQKFLDKRCRSRGGLCLSMNIVACD